jgi:hypothetical protein
MNNPSTKLEDLIHVERGIIPSHLCESIIKYIETREWKPHEWYNSSTGKSGSEEEMELDIQHATPEVQKILGKYVVESGLIYTKIYAFPFSNISSSKYSNVSGMEEILNSKEVTPFMNQFCPIRFNRYTTGQIMRPHFDHIHSIFDGENKGVPVLSFILNFNDDYEGADLYFWEDKVIKLGKGDVVMFPSNFLFPHGVTESTKGKRYSAVCWGW